jgi:hypothetical protein
VREAYANSLGRNECHIVRHGQNNDQDRGAYLRYTLDGSTPTGGPAGNGTQIAAATGTDRVHDRAAGKDVKAIAYKAELADSPVAEATYVYQSPYLN